jgi:hypothetical protein
VGCAKHHAYYSTGHPSSLVPNRLISARLWDTTEGAALHREEDAITAEVQSMNMSGVGIAPEIADHPHIVM